VRGSQRRCQPCTGPPGSGLREVVLQEGAPRLRRRVTAARHVFANTALADVDGEGDSWESKRWIRTCGRYFRTHFGGVTFARRDFFRKDSAYEAVLVRACEKQARVFVFTGSSQDIVEQLILRTELKLDLSIYGCRTHSHAASQK
jgi:hypothetical protein